MKRPTPTAVIQTMNAVIPWLLVLWGIWTDNLWPFFIGALFVVDLGLRRIWRELRDRK